MKNADSLLSRLMPCQPRKSIVGQSFGRVTVISCSGRYCHETYWLCLCECGTKKVLAKNNLVSGATRSCGCLSKENLTGNKHAETHGYSKSNEDLKWGTYLSWMSMHY